MIKKYVIVYSDIALSNIDDIFSYLAIYVDLYIAIKHIKMIKDMICSLDIYPYRCPISKTLKSKDKELRVAFVKGYRIIYYVDETNQSIHISRIITSKQDIKKFIRK